MNYYFRARGSTVIPVFLVLYCTNFFLDAFCVEKFMECGRRQFITDTSIYSSFLSSLPAAVFGSPTARNLFPWHVTIFKKSASSKFAFDYLCGGSLINYPASGEGNNFLVLTAAHCVTMRKQSIVESKDKFRVVVGTVSRDFEKNTRDTDAQVFKVSEIAIYPTYDPSRNFRADIAILQLSKPVIVGQYAQPACLPAFEFKEKDFNQTVRGELYIHIDLGISIWDFLKMSGFGFTRHGTLSDELMRVALPVINKSLCEDRRNVTLFPDTEFCAGFWRGASGCSGDSGGGLVFFNEEDNRYYLHGILSNIDARALAQFKFCQNYNIFTRVERFTNWIIEVEETFGDASESTEEEDSENGNIDDDDNEYNNSNLTCLCYTTGLVCGWAINEKIGIQACSPNHIHQCNKIGDKVTRDYGLCIDGCKKGSPNHYCYIPTSKSSSLNEESNKCKCYSTGMVCGWAMNEMSGNNVCIDSHIYECGEIGGIAEENGPCTKGCSKTVRILLRHRQIEWFQCVT